MHSFFKKNNVNNNYINNNLYFVPVIIIFILTNMINVSNKIAVSSIIYVLLAFTANLMSELSGKRKTMQILIICILLNAPLIFNINFYINGNRIDGILLGSFISLIVSIYCSVSLYLKLKSIYNFHVYNLISLFICSIVDTAIMSVFFLLSPLSTNKITSMFIYDLIFKFSYSIAVTVCFMCSIYLLDKVRIYIPR